MPRLLIQFVNEVRTVRRQPLFVIGPSDSLCDRAPLVQGQKPVARRYRGWARHLRLGAGGWFACLRTRGCRLRFCAGGGLHRLGISLRCALWPGSLCSRALELRIGEKHFPQQCRRAHPKREKDPFSHPPSLDECFGQRAVPPADPWLPLSTASQVVVSQGLSLKSGLHRGCKPGFHAQRFFFLEDQASDFGACQVIGSPVGVHDARRGVRICAE